MNKSANPKLKIAYLSDSIYPYHKGGKEKRLFDISTRIALKGHDVTIYTMKWWEGDNERFENGVRLYAICPYYPLYMGERRSIKQGMIFGIHSLKLLLKRFDVLDVDHMPYFPIFSAKVVCLLRGKKLIGTWNEVWGLEYWKKYLGYKGYIAALLEKLTFIMPTTIISISDYTTKRLRAEGFKRRIETIPLSVDYANINAVPPAKQTSDLIYAGRLLEHKNVDMLLRAVSQLITARPDLKCVIIGDGPEKSSLENLSEELGIAENVEFHGFLEEHDEVIAHMKSSKVFVFPSTREGFGLVVPEANACGLPVITTTHQDNAAKDLIEVGSNGLLTEPNDMELHKTISLALDSPITIEDTIQLTWEDIVAKLDRLYKEH